MFKNTELEARFGFEALPTIQDGKLAAIYPLNIIHPGDSPRIFSGKYVGEINHIYELLTKIVTNQTIDENNPMSYEFKFENNQIYVRDKDNSKWTLIGDVTKLYFGAKDYADSTFIKELSVNNDTITAKKGDESTSSIVINNVDNADIANKDSLGQLIHGTYIKKLSTYGGNITMYRGDGGTSIVKINNVELAQSAVKAAKDNLGQQIDVTYVKDVLESNGIVTVTKGNKQSEVLCFTSITNDIIDDILKLNEDTTLEEKEAIIDETIIDIFLNKGDGYITVYSLNSAIDTDTIDDLYLNSGLYPEPSGDECINSSEMENIFINGGVVHEVFRC